MWWYKIKSKVEKDLPITKILIILKAIKLVNEDRWAWVNNVYENRNT